MSATAAPLSALVLAGVLALAGCGGDDGNGNGKGSGSTTTTVPFGVRPTDEEMSAADAAPIDAAAQAAFAGLAGKAPAMYVGVWDPDKGAFLQAYGSAVVGGAAATVDDSLRIGSMTNTFTATVVLQLVREGELALDGTVDTYAPDLVTQFPTLAGITVEQLLSMSSGIPDYLNEPGGAIPAIVADPARVWTPAELIAEGVKLPAQPAGTLGYSSTNFVVLQVIAETVTGEPLADLIAERITEPLAIADTSLPPDDDTSLAAPAAHGYLNQGCVDEIAADGAPGLAVGTDTTDWNTSFGQGAGGVVSKLEDMGVWAETTMGNTSLSRELGNLRIRTRDLGTGLEYGLGLIKFGDFYGHAGEALGWESLALHSTRTGVTFVAATNGCNGTVETFIQLLQTLYPEGS